MNVKVSLGLGRLWHPQVTDDRLRRLCAGRPAVITGAASGMGRSLANRLVAAGVPVLLSDVDTQALAETADSAAENGATVHAAEVDVADTAAVTAYADEVVRRYGAPALVFNNAGITMVASVLDEDDDYARRILAVNFGGVVNGTEAFLRHLHTAGGGRIVNTSSAFGLMGSPAQSAYSASKFATRGYSETVQKQLRDNDSGVRIHIVYPGVVHTAIARRARYVDSAVRDRVTKGFDRRLPGTRSDAAAISILAGLLGNRDRILVGFDAYALDLGVRILAGALQRPVATVTRPVFRRILGAG
ncbi:putative oxidoreductase SadH [Gordonia sp. YY1]|nr:SDR family NAD(P)-dependent oxidoreductase [Gordonia sp. YY1]ATD72593.1 short-chain dehydrogenase [Gordonia sp. 1D]KAF0968195.1 putative oxidoreductase SadH [Gordonia sp. YY1]GAC53542.1 putative oxidoreductase [Gordonia amicalis NBRC 100051 = JCM 11271]